MTHSAHLFHINMVNSELLYLSKIWSACTKGNSIETSATDFLMVYFYLIDLRTVQNQWKCHSLQKIPW